MFVNTLNIGIKGQSKRAFEKHLFLSIFNSVSSFSFCIISLFLYNKTSLFILYGKIENVLKLYLSIILLI